jgi:hypothetical protein
MSTSRRFQGAQTTGLRANAPASCAFKSVATKPSTAIVVHVGDVKLRKPGSQVMRGR